MNEIVAEVLLIRWADKRAAETEQFIRDTEDFLKLSAPPDMIDPTEEEPWTS